MNSAFCSGRTLWAVPRARDLVQRAAGHFEYTARRRRDRSAASAIWMRHRPATGPNGNAGRARRADH